MDISLAEDIFLIAGGPSAGVLDFSRLAHYPRGYILGVKDAYFHTPADGCFTMDRRWNHHRIERLKERSAEVFASRKHWKSKWGGPFIEPWEGVHWLKVYVDRPGLSDESGILNGKNSGFAALNLAYQCNPKRIFLFGYDLTMVPDGAEHWYPTHEWRRPKTTYGNVHRWLPDHDVAARQLQEKGIEVFNVSTSSAIQCYTKISFKEVFRLLEAA